jgi:GMP synthase-like glutamine amidotransferase
MSEENAAREIPGLPDGSILYISVVTHPNHPMHALSRARLHTPPDLDVGTYVARTGPWIRRYFEPVVIDGATTPPPEDLTPYRGVMIGCSFHYFSAHRNPLAPWQIELMNFVRRVIFETELPFYGVCGGAYLGHLALGGQLVPNLKGAGINPDAEGSLIIRTADLLLTEDGIADPLFRDCPPRLPMHHIHSDYVAELPPGCRALAHCADFPNMAIAYGDRVRLLPAAHPELSDAIVHQLLPAFAGSGQFGTDPTKKDEMLGKLSHIAPTPHANQLLLSNFLRHFCADPKNKTQ